MSASIQVMVGQLEGNLPYFVDLNVILVLLQIPTALLSNG
jgi:hypothetical protein